MPRFRDIAVLPLVLVAACSGGYLYDVCFYMQHGRLQRGPTGGAMISGGALRVVKDPREAASEGVVTVLASDGGTRAVISASVVPGVHYTCFDTDLVSGTKTQVKCNAVAYDESGNVLVGEGLAIGRVDGAVVEPREENIKDGDTTVAWPDPDQSKIIKSSRLIGRSFFAIQGRQLFRANRTGPAAWAFENIAPDRRRRSGRSERNARAHRSVDVRSR